MFKALITALLGLLRLVKDENGVTVSEESNDPVDPVGLGGPSLSQGLDVAEVEVEASMLDGFLNCHASLTSVTGSFTGLAGVSSNLNILTLEELEGISVLV